MQNVVHTQTFVTLEVSENTFEDIQARLKEVEMLDEYLMCDQSAHDCFGADALVFGNVGFVKENV